MSERVLGESLRIMYTRFHCDMDGVYVVTDTYLDLAESRV